MQENLESHRTIIRGDALKSGLFFSIKVNYDTNIYFQMLSLLSNLESVLFIHVHISRIGETIFSKCDLLQAAVECSNSKLVALTNERSFSVLLSSFTISIRNGIR